MHNSIQSFSCITNCTKLSQINCNKITHKSPDETDRAWSWSLLQMRDSKHQLLAKTQTPGDSDSNCTPLINCTAIDVTSWRLSLTVIFVPLLQPFGTNRSPKLLHHRHLLCRVFLKSRICILGCFEKTAETRLSKCHQLPLVLCL